MKIACIGIFLILISGCTATYHPASQEKLITMPPPVLEGQEAATIVVKRDKSYAGSALDARFYFDEEHIITLSHAETYTFMARPGKHTLKVKSLQPISFIPVPFSRELEVDLEPSHTYEYIFKAIPMAGIEIVVTD